MQTIGSQLNKHRGIGPGFDLVRVGLATLVVLWHSIPIVTGGNFADRTHFLWFGDYAILAAFFSLSGFLITGSAQRLHLGNFLLNRGLRIFPALALEITLSVFILGVIFTALPLGAYFSSPKTLHYFTNIVGLINFYLPGVFTHNPDGQVNVSLWTVPHELGCYLIMTVLVLTQSFKHRFIAPMLAVGMVVAGLCMLAFHIQSEGPLRVFYARGSQLYVGFLVGITMWLFRHQIPYSRVLAALAFVICLIVAAIGPLDVFSYPLVSLLAAAPLVYLTIFLGVSELPTPSLLQKGDYSYGIYLYGYPIQQSIKALFPSISSVWFHFFVSMLVIAPFSALSWHLLEKRILGLRRRFSFVARIRDTPEASAKPIDDVPAAP